MKEIIISREILIEHFKKTRIFHFLNDLECEKIIDVSKVVQYKNEEVIIQEGEISSHLYIILSGAISVVANKDGGGQVYICTIGDGEVFGEAAIFLNVKRTANVIATDEVNVVMIKREDFINFIKKYPDAGIKILMLIIYSLLNKLSDVKQELVFERQSVINQENIDSIIANYLNE